MKKETYSAIWHARFLIESGVAIMNWIWSLMALGLTEIIKPDKSANCMYLKTQEWLLSIHRTCSVLNIVHDASIETASTLWMHNSVHSRKYTFCTETESFWDLSHNKEHVNLQIIMGTVFTKQDLKTACSSKGFTIKTRTTTTPMHLQKHLPHPLSPPPNFETQSRPEIKLVQETAQFSLSRSCAYRTQSIQQFKGQK